MSHAALGLPFSIQESLTALRRQYEVRAAEYARIDARIDASAFCGLVVEDLDGLWATLRGVVRDVPTSGAAAEVTGDLSGIPASDATRCADDEPARRSGSQARRVAYRRRLQRELDAPQGTQRTSPLAVARIQNEGYDPNADARTVAASLRAQGGKR